MKTTRLQAVAIALALFGLGLGAAARAQALPDLLSYTFTSAETKTLPGTSMAPGAQCGGTIAAADQVGALGLAAQFYQNACYSDGRYNHGNFKVDRGTIAASGSATTFAAYRMYEPATKATQFLGSQHAIYYRFPTKENYTVYSFSGGALAKVTEVLAAAIANTTDLTPVLVGTTPLSVSGVVGSIIYVFVPSSTRVSTYASLATGVEGARIASTAFGDVLKYRYTVTGTPYDATVDNALGPSTSTYQDTRRFFLVRNGDNLGVIWQAQTGNAVNLTWFGADRKSPTTVALPNSQAQLLACAIGDDAGNVYYLTVQAGSGAPNTARAATLTKAGPIGTAIVSTALDTSANALNMVAFESNVASLRLLNGRLALMIGRTMHQGDDGLNHQGGIAVVFNATTLAMERNHEQTSGHSFDNVLATNSGGQFLGIDLGDNFPRGVNLHKFDATTIDSRVVSTFKTRHGTTPSAFNGGPTYPVYTAISGGGTTYYQWSNDNRTYTELGGVIQTPLGYTVGFIGERSPAGGLLDNTRTASGLNDPRNIGWVTVREDFQNASGGGTEVSDDLVLTTGLVETSTYYSFTGGATPQRNAGVVWLTQYATTAQNASRLKMAPRADGSVLLLWEIWTANAYVATRAMTVAANGTVVNAETDLTSNVRFTRRDDPMRVNNSIYLVSGSKPDNSLELIVVEPQATAGANLAADPASMNFGDQSLTTTSLPRTLVLRNNGSSAVTVNGITSSAAFIVAHACTVVAAGGSCNVTVSFRPQVEGTTTAAMNVAWSGGTLGVTLTGVGKKSLTTHYYSAILNRSADASGEAFWDREADRVSALGVHVNEVWFALAQTFFSSAEYLNQNRDNAGFVSDLYETFLNRDPDASGLAYWSGQLAAGMPREVVLASFMFSTEFNAFTTGLFGAPTNRKEIDMVVDFYRGLLSRLPDDGGFAFWLARFRAAQCQGAAAVTTQADSVSSAYISSSEYAARNRTNAQFVGDLYNAFLRRGGDLAGVQFWIGQLAAGSLTREQVRRNFLGSPEFSARVQGVIAQGCLQ